MPSIIKDNEHCAPHGIKYCTRNHNGIESEKFIGFGLAVEKFIGLGNGLIPNVASGEQYLVKASGTKSAEIGTNKRGSLENKLPPLDSRNGEINRNANASGLDLDSSSLESDMAVGEEIESWAPADRHVDRKFNL